MIANLPPAAILILGSLIVPLLRGRIKSIYLLALPLLSLLHLLGFNEGFYGEIVLFDYSLTMVRVDKLSLLFGYIFHIAAFVSVIYALHVKDNLQHVTGLAYVGSAIGAVFAGDLITLFVYWELTAVASVFLIWARRNRRAYAAGMRYLIIQVGSGVLLLAGTLLHLHETGSIAFGYLGLNSLGTTLIFAAFGIKCAFPLLHNWLQDAYPEATVTGTVFLSTFTTKLAIYTLARGFPGTEILIPIGAVMTVFPIFYAVIENDLRRVLAYSLNNQLGFMVAGIGVGTAMGINGAVSHAFAHILYKALLFMSMGAVLYRTGTIKASELGGLYKSMPFTTVCCLIGAASISAFPPLSGFVTKSMTLTAVAQGGFTISWFALLFASEGVMHHSGIKIPFYGFFGRDSGIRYKEAPLNMRIAMGLTAALCVTIGVYRYPLYQILPHATNFEPYTSSHVITQLQLLMFALLAFAILARKHLETPEIPSTNLDSDWIYRRFVPALLRSAVRAAEPVKNQVYRGGRVLVSSTIRQLQRHHDPQGLWGRTWLTGRSVLMVVIVLAVFLLFYYY